jgi:tetratricopeptide (TPR) repeat protein
MRLVRRNECRTPFLAAAAAVVCLGALVSSACASHRVTPSDDFASYLARMKAQAPDARPPKNPASQTVEMSDPLLAAALAVLANSPTPAAHRQVATEYRRLGVLDSAHAHFTEAMKLDPHNAAAYDGRARVWRDFGFPGLGLSDAYRAIHYAPLSAAAANTLGTLFEAMGRLGDARSQYSRALQLDPSATFAMTNLCHIDTMLGRRVAVAACRTALSASPASGVAHNNLALAYAVAGDFPRAYREFLVAGDLATAQYNMGIMYMASRQPERAAEAFRSARQTNPEFALAGERLRQLAAIPTE